MKRSDRLARAIQRLARLREIRRAGRVDLARIQVEALEEYLAEAVQLIPDEPAWADAERSLATVLAACVLRRQTLEEGVHDAS